MQNSKLGDQMEQFSARKSYYEKFVILVILCSALWVMAQSLSAGTLLFNDSFPGRSDLITTFSFLKMKLGDTVFSQLLAEKDGFFEYTNGGNLDDYQNTIDHSKDVTISIQKNLQIINEYLKKKNISLVLVVAPNKATIYPEKIPDKIVKINPESRLDMLVNLLKKQGPDILIDLRPALLKGKKTERIYYKTDSHWNARGAFIGYATIFQYLSQTYPELKPNLSYHSKIIKSQPAVLDLPSLVGATFLKEPRTTFDIESSMLRSFETIDNQGFRTRTFVIPGSRLPRVLIYHDSFFNPLLKPIASHFSLTTFHHLLSYTESSLPVNQIEIIKPDIVIIEVVERSLPILKKLLEEFGATLPK